MADQARGGLLSPLLRSRRIAAALFEAEGVGPGLWLRKTERTLCRRTLRWR